MEKQQVRQEGEQGMMQQQGSYREQAKSTPYAYYAIRNGLRSFSTS